MNKLYLAKIDKKEYEKIKNKSIKEVNEKGYTDMFGMPYSFLRIILSSDIDIDFDDEFLEENTFPFFQKYIHVDEEYNFFVCKNEKVIRRIIEAYEEKIKEIVKEFFFCEDEYDKAGTGWPKGFEKNSVEELNDTYNYFNRMSSEWVSGGPYILPVADWEDRKNIRITSFFYEHLIFEALFLYKYFNFEKDYMVLLLKK